ncbi:hypothetical protein [Helicobacter pametensis]|uniref:hypothetical protein n=1 Tax=Helicobacter pametensis TaxID=95149 RepID=UPI0004862C5A|nr:hypothetical protein [Helicobacter pametensis]
MFGLIRKLYSKIFIGIHLDKDTCHVNIIRTKNGKIRQNIKTQTKLINNTISMETLKLIHFYRKRHPFTFIGMMSKTPYQGAIPSVDPQDFIQHQVNIKQNDFITFQTWSAYIDKSACGALTHQIKEIGPLDCLFSPFIFIFMQAQKYPRLTLYVLQEKESLSLAIADQQCLYTGKTFILQDGDASFELQSSQSSISSLDRLLESLNEDIDKLDSKEISKGASEDEEGSDEARQSEELNDFVRATSVVQILEENIQTYYKSNQSSFIHEIIFFDTYGITPDAIQYIRDTLLIEMRVIPFSPAEEISTLMFKEHQRNQL